MGSGIRDKIRKKIMPEDVYICYNCCWKSSVKRIKPGQFLCNECLKIWEGGKFYQGEKIMSDNYVMIDGKKIDLSNETVRNLKKELGIQEEIKFGDIVTCHFGLRAVLYDSTGTLIAVNKYGNKTGSVNGNSCVYTRIGKNIFENNALNLNE